MLGLGNSCSGADRQPGEGGEEGADLPLQEVNSYLAGKSCWDLATLMFQVLTAYPGKEVKKGLTDLYRKVEKHLSEDENLLQVQE